MQAGVQFLEALAGMLAGNTGGQPRTNGQASPNGPDLLGPFVTTDARTGQPLGPASENYKAHCHRIDRPIQVASTLIGDPQRFIEDAVQFRQFCCPACGGLIENEVCRAQDPLLRDVELHGR